MFKFNEFMNQNLIRDVRDSRRDSCKDYDNKKERM